MAESARDRAKRYDRIGRAIWTFGPPAIVLLNTGQWLFSLVTLGGYVTRVTVAFHCILIGLAALWMFYRLRRKAPDA